jgi:tetratricopeptide (TPR) repeat protein
LGGDRLLASEILGNLGNVALRKSRYPEARESFEKARALQEQLLEPGDPRRARVTYSLGLVALGEGDKPRAVALLKEALQQTEVGKGADHPETALRHYTLSQALREVGQAEQALTHARAAVDIRKAALGEHPDVADSMDAVGMCLISLGRHEEARETFEEALAMKQALLGPEDPLLSYSYDGIGQALLAAGRPAEAVAPLEKALHFEDIEPEALAESGFALARALWESGKERARALEVAEKARERYAQAGQQELVQKVEAWLATARAESPAPPKKRPGRPERSKRPRR